MIRILSIAIALLNFSGGNAWSGDDVEWIKNVDRFRTGTPNEKQVAVEFFIEKKDPRTVALMENFLTIPEFSENAMTVLSAKKETRSLRPLGLALEMERNQTVKHKISRTMAAIDPKAAFDVVIPMLDPKNHETFDGVVIALSYFKDNRALPFLIPIAEDQTLKDSRREIVVETLAEYSDLKAVAPALRRLAKDVSLEIRYDAVLGLSKIEDLEAGYYLYEFDRVIKGSPLYKEQREVLQKELAKDPRFELVFKILANRTGFHRLPEHLDSAAAIGIFTFLSDPSNDPKEKGWISCAIAGGDAKLHVTSVKGDLRTIATRKEILGATSDKAAEWLAEIEREERAYLIVLPITQELQSKTNEHLEDLEADKIDTRRNAVLELEKLARDHGLAILATLSRALEAAKTRRDPEATFELERIVAMADVRRQISKLIQKLDDEKSDTRAEAEAQLNALGRVHGVKIIGLLEKDLPSLDEKEGRPRLQNIIKKIEYRIPPSRQGNARCAAPPPAEDISSTVIDMIREWSKMFVPFRARPEAERADGIEKVLPEEKKENQPGKAPDAGVPK